MVFFLIGLYSLWHTCTTFPPQKKEKKTIECGPMPNVMAAQLNIVATLCKISAITFLVACLKTWLTPAG